MVQTEDSKITSEGNNSTTTPYPVPFYFLNNSEVIVVVKDSAGLEQRLVLNTDYTVTGAGNPAGGSIKTTAPVSTASTVTRFRELPVTQLTSYEEGDAFPAKSHEKALDKLTMLIQQVMRATGGLESELEGDRARAFRLTEASGGIKALSKITDSTLGIDTAGESVLRTPVEMLAWLGQVGTFWHDAAERAHTRGAFPGQTGVQLDNWTLYIAHSTEPGNWVPFLSSSGVVISTNGTPSAKPNPAGDIVGTSESQVLSNKTLNAPTINNPTGMTRVDVGLGQVDNTSDANKPVSVPTLLALESKQGLAQKAVADGYASLDTTGKVPIAQIPSSLIGGNAAFQTSWNANANIPPILSGSASAANNGFYYLVSVAGTTVVDSITSWAVGDMIISDGTKWVKIIATSAVSSVAGKIGAVTLVKADVGLGNVDNTSDSTKASATATFTNKTINGANNTLVVRLENDVTGNLPTARLNNGTGASNNTWWCGDGSWRKPPGSGDVAGAGTSISGGIAVYSATDGKSIGPYIGGAGFAKLANPGGAVTAVDKITGPDLDPSVIHGQQEKLLLTDDDEMLIWDSATGTFKKVKRQNLGVPVGCVMDFASDDINHLPPGWLICGGQAISRTTYSRLWVVIGGYWGVGDGTTTFNVPDLRGFVVAGKDDMGGANAGRLNTAGVQATSVAGAMGAQTHTVTVAQMPSHYHNPLGGQTAFLTAGAGGAGFTISGTWGATGATGNTGGDQAHNNIQPTRIMNKIIKY